MRSAARPGRPISPGSTRTTTASGATRRRTAATTSSTARTRSPSGCSARGYQTIHLGKYLNGYGTRNATEVPPGWGLWYGSVDPTTYRFYNYTLNENGRTVNYGTGTANYQTDVYAQKAVNLIAGQAADPRPFFLSVAFLAPHSGGPRDPDDPPGLGTPSPAPRHRNVFRTQALPIPPSFNEADVSDKPAAFAIDRS